MVAMGEGGGGGGAGSGLGQGVSDFNEALNSAKQFMGEITGAGIDAMQFIQLQHFKLQMATAQAETSKQVADAIAAAAR